ncbi:VOC family protein [Nocardia jiangsuensis]|uniref:VOC family protein n=1 Tax=Nocardia jiangsuensis TaxID=1691563 RepID=A0ABV8DNT3_9NOCA
MTLSAITLGVRDLERSLRFYRDGLGLPFPGIVGTEFAGDAERPGGATAMLSLGNGLILSLYGRDDLAKDAGVTPDRVTGSGVSLGWFVERRGAVDDLLERAAAAGGTVVRAPLERPWGIYAGYFGDPDGHLWEVVYFLPS